MASQIDYNSFLSWCENRFGVENIKISGNEICTHSIFIEDHKYHLCMNPFGGKKEREGGVYRCWKSNKYGSLISLVSQLDKISYEEAEDLICSSLSLRALELKVDEFFGQYDNTIPKQAPITLSKKFLNLPPETYKFEELDSFDKDRFKEYISKRKLSLDSFYYCTGGDYYDRIIIPYKNETEDIIWYNARAIKDGKNIVKYMKPKQKEFSQDSCLFFTSFPKYKTKIYLTEGEFDALTLAACGFVAVACGGKTLTDSQIEILRNYIPVLAFDNDENAPVNYGLKSVIDVGRQLISKGFDELYYIRPSKGFKDWNEILMKMNPDIIKHYITKYEKRLNQIAISQLTLI